MSTDGEIYQNMQAGLAKWRQEFPELAAANDIPFDAKAYWERLSHTTKNRKDFQSMVRGAATFLEASGINQARVNPVDWTYFLEAMARAQANDWQVGFLFIGKPGCGKTSLLRALVARGYSGTDAAAKWAYTTANDMSRELAAQSGPLDNERTWHRSHLCIDELGGEPTLNHYGQKNEVLGIVLDARERIPAWRGVTVIATNLPLAELKIRYGERAWSRLQSLCYLVQLVTGDNRVPAAVKRSARPKPADDPEASFL